MEVTKEVLEKKKSELENQLKEFQQMAFNGNQGVERCMGALQFTAHLLEELEKENKTEDKK